MRPTGGDNGPRQIHSAASVQIYPLVDPQLVKNASLKNTNMITQNPIIGRAKNKLAGVYARTLYGKNVLQSCPPPTKGHQTPSQQAVCSAFGRVSRLANQLSASMLNQIYYSAPQGRSRRAQWCKDLAKGMTKVDTDWIFNPSLIETLGGNPKVSTEPFIVTPTQTSLEISSDALSATTIADKSKVPCLVLICIEANVCISLVPYTSINDGTITLSNLSSTLVGKECYIFPLWQTNVGTTTTPIYAYGRYGKDI